MGKPRHMLAAILGLILTLSWLAPRPALALSMSVKKEKELGAEAYQEVMAQLKMVDDRECQAYINQLGRKLLGAAEDDLFTYRFHLVDSPQVNAFALPGGYIFIFSGLVTFMDTEAELAGVLAHEIGHVKHRHLASRLDRSKPVQMASLAGMLAGVLLGAVAGAPALGQAMAAGSVAGGVQAQLAFSREDEEQADFAAFKTLSALGYPPQDMVKGFAKIWRLERMTSPEVPTYLRTHPQSPQRMDRIESLLRRNPVHVRPQDNSEFLRIRTRLVALYDPPGQASTRFQRQRRQRPHDPMPIYGLALLAIRSGEYQQALDILKQAGPEAASQPYLVEARAQCQLLLGNYRQASPLFEQVLASKPDDRTALMGLGQAYLNQGQLPAARRPLERLVKLEPEDDQALYQLGITMGRMGKTSLAALYLGRSFKLKGNFRMARYHLKRAQDAPELSPQQRQEASDLLKDLADQEKKKQKRDQKREQEKSR